MSAFDLEGRTIWIVDANGYGKRFIVRADEMLSAFLELETAIQRVRGGCNVLDTSPVLQIAGVLLAFERCCHCRVESKGGRRNVP